MQARRLRKAAREAAMLPLEGAALVRYVRELRGFLRAPLLGPAEARERVRAAHEQRGERFCALLREAVFGFPGSPYLPLVRHAGIELGDVEALVRDGGVEATLERLFDAGVRLTSDEFKCYRPVERPGLTTSPSFRDFDNPRVTVGFVGRSGGSRGARRRVRISLDLIEHEVCYDWLWEAGFGVPADAPSALWRPTPPGGAGLKQALRFSKRGRPIERWFSQNQMSVRNRRGKDYAFAVATFQVSRLLGKPIARPEHVPPGQALTVARWLEGKTAAGTPAVLCTPATSCVRVCLAARDAGLDIAGTLFFIGGEPVTDAKVEAAAERGCRVVANYAMAEVGLMAISCPVGEGADDLHLLGDKIAMIRRERPVTGGGTAGALYLTTLHRSTPTVMLNVESGDAAELEERACGCPFAGVGFTRHMRAVRSYEKLTSEGMTFSGPKLVELVEQVLPARFGGGPLDYQLVEEEGADGLLRVAVVVGPGVGEVDDAVVVDAVIAHLSTGPGGRRMMAGVWQAGETLRVVRREPYVTDAAKVQPLHVVRDACR